MKKQRDNFRILPILLPLVIYFLVYNLVGGILAFFISQCMSNSVEHIVIQMICTLVGIITLGFIAKDDEVNFTPTNLGKLEYIKKCPNALLPIIVAIIGLGLNILFTCIGINNLSPTATTSMRAQFMVPLIPGLILYGFLVPIAEEMIYRGLIYTRLKKSFPITLSIFVSSLMFGAYHGNIVQGLYGFLMGILLALVYESTGNISVPIISHGLTNAIVFFITYDGKFLNNFVK